MDCLRSKIAVASAVLLGLQLQPCARPDRPATAKLNRIGTGPVFDASMGGDRLRTQSHGTPAYWAAGYDLRTGGLELHRLSTAALRSIALNWRNNANQLLGRGEKNAVQLACAWGAGFGFALRWKADEESPPKDHDQ